MFLLNLLKGGRLSAGEICEHFSVTGASISRHLAILKDADLTRSKREEMPAELVCVSPNQESSKNNRYCGYKSQYLLFFDKIAGVMGPGR